MRTPVESYEVPSTNLPIVALCSGSLLNTKITKDKLTNINKNEIPTLLRKVNLLCNESNQINQIIKVIKMACAESVAIEDILTNNANLTLVYFFLY